MSLSIYVIYIYIHGFVLVYCGAGVTHRRLCLYLHNMWTPYLVCFCCFRWYGPHLNFDILTWGPHATCLAYRKGLWRHLANGSIDIGEERIFDMTWDDSYWGVHCWCLSTSKTRVNLRMVQRILQLNMLSSENVGFFWYMIYVLIHTEHLWYLQYVEYVTAPSCDSSGKHNVAFLVGMIMELFGSISRQYVLYSILQ